MDRALERDLLMLKDRRTRCPRLQHHLGRARGPLDSAREGAVLAAIGPRGRRRRRRRVELQPVEHAALGFLALDTPRRGSLDRLRLESVEHAPPRLPLTRGLRLLLAPADRPWILPHFARISTARRQDLDPLRSEEHTAELQSLLPIPSAVSSLQ